MAKSLKTDDYEKLALETTGLVPMRFLKATMTDRKSDIAGFEPHTAKRMHDDGLAEPVGEVDTAAEDEIDEDGESDDDARRSAVDIPDGWDSLHHLKRVSIAKEITGTESGMTASEADAAINAELARRQDAG